MRTVKPAPILTRCLDPSGSRQRKTLKVARVCVAFALSLAVACGSGSNTRAEEDNRAPVADRAVQFATSDGITLTGRLFGTGRVGVVLAHMLPADASSWYATARRLARDGYLALAFNFRGYDGSQGTKSTTKAPLDIKAARDLVVRSGARDVAFIGASTGGTAAVVAAEELDPPALVVVSAPLRFGGLDAVLAAGRVQRPVLLLAARDDQQAIQSVETFLRAFSNGQEEIVDGAAHGTNLIASHPEAVDALVTFLQRYAPPVEPSSTP